MLKGCVDCWECIASSSNNRNSEQNEVYGRPVNGNVQQTEWPTSPEHKDNYPNEKMFMLPRKLEIGDVIHIHGQFTSDRNMLIVNLVTATNGMVDRSNVACQLDIQFRADKMALQTITNDITELAAKDIEEKPSDMFVDSTFEFNFRLEYIGGNNAVDVYIGPSFLGRVSLRHSLDSIRFLSVYGDVEKIKKLEFEFA